jgi:hypothetical protein
MDIKEKKMHKVTSNGRAVDLNEYNGTYELVAGNVSDDKFYIEWCIGSEYDQEKNVPVPRKRENGKWMCMPVKVVLGDKTHAVEVLQQFIDHLVGAIAEKTEESDVPF